MTGGVMEAAVRTVYAVVTEGETLPRLELTEVRGLEGLKECEVSLKSESTGKGLDRALRLAVVNGLNNAKTLIADMRDGKRVYDFVEVMACPGGCIGGGGQPRAKPGSDALKKRAEAVYGLDRCAVVRASHENPAIGMVYDKWLVPGFGSEKAREALHVDLGGVEEEEEEEEEERAGEEKKEADVFPFPPRRGVGVAEDGDGAASRETAGDAANGERECESCGLRYVEGDARA